jgi:hypothetical protein
MTTKHYETQQFVNGVVGSVATGLVATGTDLATGLALTPGINVVGTTASGTGVVLPAATQIGATVTVQNLGGSDLKVYPPDSSSQINNASMGVGITLTTANRQIGEFRRLTATTWLAFVSNGPQS